MDTKNKLLLWKNCNEIDSWVVHSEYALEDWQYEVSQNYTRQSYYNWVKDQIEIEGDMEELMEGNKNYDPTDVKEIKDAFWAALGGR